MTVTGTLKSGSGAIWVLSWNTFLETNIHDCLSVTRNGAPVPYSGATASRGNPRKEAYVRIAGGGSESRQIDIGQSYAIDEPGEYQACFRMHILAALETVADEWPEDESLYLPALLESRKVTFQVVGDAFALPNRSLETMRLDAPVSGPKSYPDEPKSPTLKGMTQGENENFLQAHRWAYKSILAALKNLDKVDDSKATPEFSQWFDVRWVWGYAGGWKERRELVKTTLNKMAARMSNSSIVYQRSDPADPETNKQCTFDEMAWTRRNSNAPISLCPKALNDHWLRFLYWRSADWARAFILVHEISHLAGDTEDGYYNWSICEQLPTYNPNLAVKNAQSYALFAMWCNPVAPSGSPADNGIFKRQIGGDGCYLSQSPAAAAIAGNSVMVAFRERDTSRLCYKCLQARVNSGLELWQAHKRIRTQGGSECSSPLGPALAASGSGFFCAYIDESNKLRWASAPITAQAQTGNWTDLVWSEPDTIPSGACSDKLGPALAVFNGFQYCAYVSAAGELKCVSKIDSWARVDFDKPRHSVSAPAFVVFAKQLKCAYRDRETGKLVMLTLDLSTRNGTWRADAANPTIDADSIALAPTYEEGKPQMVALGNGKSGDRNLRYAPSQGNNWNSVLEVRMTTFSSPDGPALVACGDRLYAFFRREDNSLDAIVAD
jgi:hypothetical protein